MIVAASRLGRLFFWHTAANNLAYNFRRFRLLRSAGILVLLGCTLIPGYPRNATLQPAKSLDPLSVAKASPFAEASHTGFFWPALDTKTDTRPDTKPREFNPRNTRIPLHDLIPCYTSVNYNSVAS